MSKIVAELLRDLPIDLHDNFLKLVEYDFWKFQYTSRHFQMHYNESSTKKIPYIETRKYPRFQEILKIANDKVALLKEKGKSEEVIKREVENFFARCKESGWDAPDEIFEAYRDVLFRNNKRSSRRKLKSTRVTTRDCFAKNR